MPRTKTAVVALHAGNPGCCSCGRFAAGITGGDGGLRCADAGLDACCCCCCSQLRADIVCCQVSDGWLLSGCEADGVAAALAGICCRSRFDADFDPAACRIACSHATSNVLQRHAARAMRNIFTVHLPSCKA